MVLVEIKYFNLSRHIEQSDFVVVFMQKKGMLFVDGL